MYLVVLCATDKPCICTIVLSHCSSFYVSWKLWGLRSATLGMENLRARISAIMFGRGSEVMLWKHPNASLYHEGGEILIPKVAESECINCKHYIKWQTYRNKTILCGNATLRQFELSRWQQIAEIILKGISCWPYFIFFYVIQKYEKQSTNENVLLYVYSSVLPFFDSFH